MTAHLELQFLPADEGDSVWIRWGDGHQALVDMGTTSTGKAIHHRFAALTAKQRHFDLLVVTHVDSDHIGGVLTGLVTAKTPGLTFDDVWFNGWDNTHGRPSPHDPSPLEPMGPKQGEQLSRWLRARHWNSAFGGGPVIAGVPTVTLPGGVKLTVLGPTMGRLAALAPAWDAVLRDALARDDEEAPAAPVVGLEVMGRAPPKKPALTTVASLAKLADSANGPDPSIPNGSSIVVLLTWRHRRVLLTGDAFGDDVAAALAALPGDDRVPIDVLKMPHHGSRNNTFPTLVDAVDCATWVVSSNGKKYFHPDAAALARVIRGSNAPTLVFTEPSEFNGWWDNDAWRKEFDYSTIYGDATDGVTVTLSPGKKR